jgi:hydroxymethylbilane synthase
MKIKLGVRGSKLALAYADIVKRKINSVGDYDVEVIVIKTDGDIYAKKNIAEIGGKGVFVTKIEQQLLDGNIDIAVHSFKDLPKDLHDDTDIFAVMKRHDPRDAVIGNLVDGCKIGTSSPRRKLQLAKMFPNSEILPIRGNIDTRIQKVRDNEYDATILAMAGLDTMDLGHEISKVLALEELVPAVGQGVIAVQSLKDQNTVLLEQINHLETYQCAMAERNMLQMVDGDCDTAIGSITGRIGDIISLEAYNYENNKSVKMQSKAIDYLNLGELAGNKIK